MMRPRKCDEPRSKSFAGGISTFASKHRALFGFSSRFMQYWKDAEMQLTALRYGEEPDSFLHSIWSYVEDAFKKIHSKDVTDPNEAFVGVEDHVTHGDRLKQQLDIITFIINSLVTHLSVWSVQLRLCLRFLEFYQKNKRCGPSQENEGTQVISQRNEESWHCRGGEEGKLQSSVHYLFVEIFSASSRALFVAEQEALISVKSSATKHQSTQFKSTNNANGAALDRLIENWSASARFSILQDFDDCLVQGLRLHSNSIEEIFRKIVAAIDKIVTLKTVTDLKLRHQQFNILAEHALSGTNYNYSNSLQTFLSGNWINKISVPPLQPRVQSEQQGISFDVIDDWSRHLLDLFHYFGTREEVLLSVESLMDYLYHDNGYLVKALDNGTSNVVETSFNNDYFFWLLVSVLQLPGNNDIGTSQSSKENKLVQSTFERPSDCSATNAISLSSLTFDQKHGWAMLLNLLVHLVETVSSDVALTKLRSYSVEHLLQPSPLLDFLCRMSLLPTDKDLLQVPSRISFLSLDITLGRYFSFNYDSHGNVCVPNANDFTSQLFDVMVVHADKLDTITTENIKKLAAKYSKWILPEKVVRAYKKLLEDVIKTNAYTLEPAETGSEDKRYLQRKIIYATDMIVEVFATENRSCASIWQAVFTKEICLGLSMGIYSHPDLVDRSNTQGAIGSGNPIATIPIVLAHIGTYYSESSTSRSETKISNCWKELIKEIMIPYTSQSWTFLKENVLYKHSEVWNQPSCHTELINSTGMKSIEWQREHLQEKDTIVFASNREIEQSWYAATKKETSFPMSPEISEGNKWMSRGRPSGTHEKIQHKVKKKRLERVQQETQENVFCENIESSAEEDGYESDEVILLNCV